MERGFDFQKEGGKMKPSDKIATLGAQQVDYLENDPNWVYSKRHEFSLEKLKQKYPDGAPDKVICSVLQLTPEELEEVWEDIIKKLRGIMKVEID